MEMEKKDRVARSREKQKAQVWHLREQGDVFQESVEGVFLMDLI